MLSVFIRSTLRRLLTPPELRGRVGAVERVFIGGSNELGTFESGTAAASARRRSGRRDRGILAMVAAAFWACGSRSCADRRLRGRRGALSRSPDQSPR